jgi:hypothetical protein
LSAMETSLSVTEKLYYVAHSRMPMSSSAV